jgi:hypothetical protein
MREEILSVDDGERPTEPDARRYYTPGGGENMRYSSR